MAVKYTKWPLNIPNGHKICQMVINQTHIFHYKTLRNLPKFGFLFENIIWQPSMQPSQAQENIPSIGIAFAYSDQDKNVCMYRQTRIPRSMLHM
jgi:hypothetical protein